MTYTAKYKETVNKYTVTFVDEDGTTILMAAAEYEYGTAAGDIVKPTDPTKEATAEFTYSFAGWTPEIAAVTANVTYKAAYTSVTNQYTLSGEIDHGTVTGPVEVAYGEKATITFTPAAGYKFQSYTVNDGSATSITTSEETWTYEEQQLTANKRVVVTTAAIEYTISYELEGGALPEGVTNPGIYTVETETFTLNNPTKAGYKFLGWATSDTATTGDMTVTIEKGTTGDKTFYAIWENQFEPGRVTSSVNVSGDTITVVNSNSNVDVYIRAAIVVNWMDGQGNVRGIAPTASDYSLNVNTASWWMDTATGLYYYKNSVAPGSSTDALVDGITVYGTVPDGYQLSVEVVAEAIQAEGETDIGDVPAYQNAWKITSISGS